MNIFFSIVLSVLPSIVFADPEVAKSNSSGPKNTPGCQYGNLGVLKTTNPSSTPNYFFRTFNYNGKEYVSYASNSKLNLLDLNNGREYPFRGPYDPVPMGSDIITVPADGDGTMKLYAVDDIVNGNKYPEKQNVDGDSTFGGVYQSIGTYSKDARSTKYRVITDKDNATLAEYEIAGNKRIKMSSTPKKLCPNVTFKLPMISKDGTMMSGYEETTGKTKVWKIDAKTLNCEELLDLGIGVGKADFSYDNNLLAFHTTSASTPNGYFSTPGGSSMNMNVYVYDIKKKMLKKMTQNEAVNNSYYPVFRPDNTIVYSHINQNSEPTFVHADPKKVSGIFYDPKEMLGEQTKKLHYLGLMWSQKCLGEYSSYSTAVTTALNMDSEECKDMVDQHWDEVKRTISKSKDLYYLKAELKAACPERRSSTTAVQGFKNVNSNDLVNENSELKPGEKLLATKCSLCHSNFSVRSLQQNRLNKEFAKKIIYRINASAPERMPQSGSLSESEKEILEKYLKAI